MLSQTQTRQIAKSFYEGILAQRNVGALACALNLSGEECLVTELFTVRGFKDLLSAALPPEQRDIGHLGRVARG